MTVSGASHILNPKTLQGGYEVDTWPGFPRNGYDGCQRVRTLHQAVEKPDHGEKFNSDRGEAPRAGLIVETNLVPGAKTPERVSKIQS